jgi:spore coat polysaccharide biosynthesis predicted glycosyltransferase SpsG
VALFVADGGSGAGLGHVARSSALAVAVARRGFLVRCRAVGAESSLDLDGIAWEPADDLDDALSCEGPAVLVLDSYRIGAGDVAAVPPEVSLVVIQEHVAPPARAALVVSAGLDRAPEGSGRLHGLEYVCLRPRFWRSPRRLIPSRIRRALVTTGGGDGVPGLGPRLALAARVALPGAAIALVRGPYGTGAAPAGVELVDAPVCLYDELVAADAVVSTGGQTLLEAAAVGAPTIAVVAAENQRRQAERLAACGAVRLVELPADEVGSLLRVLDADADLRRELARNAQSAVDGRGAERVSERIASLAAVSGAEHDAP